MKRPFTDEDLNDFLKEIEAKRADLLQEWEGYQSEVGGALYNAGEVETAYNALLLYEKHKRPDRRPLQTAEEARDLINALKAVYTVLKDENTPETTKDTIKKMYNPLLFFFGFPDPESPAVQAFFDMREELSEDHPLKARFIEAYIGALVFDRFYKADMEAKDAEIRARGEDPEDYDPKTTEERKRADDEYSEHFNNLCKEYGLNNFMREMKQ